MINIKKEKIKNFIREKLKLLLGIGISLFVLIETIVYAQKYYVNNNLSFTHEDKFLFIIFMISIAFVCGMVIYLIIKQKNLLDLLHKVYQAIIDSEDNIIRFEKNTQEMILKLFNRNKNNN